MSLFYSETNEEDRPKAHPSTRLLYSGQIGLTLPDYMLDIGPVRLSVFDLLTLIPPRGVEQLEQSGFKVPSDFEKGWLSDTVRPYFVFHFKIILRYIIR